MKRLIGRAVVSAAALATLALAAPGAHAQPTIYTLVSPTSPPYQFGSAVAVGDVNGDGHDDLAIGAPLESTTSDTTTGRVHVFSGATGALLYTLSTPYPSGGGGYFGEAVAIGDLNGDGNGDVIVGAPRVPNGGFEGRVHLFNGLTGAPFFISTLQSPNSQPYGFFGWAVEAADFNGDGKAEVVVGAPREGVGSSADQGRVYVIDVNNLTTLATIVTPHPESFLDFGRRITLGDVTNDNIPDVIVGVFFATVGVNPAQGRAYAFSGANFALAQTYNTPNGESGGSFGISVDAGDWNLDGIDDVAIGAVREDAGNVVDRGRAYVLDGPSGAPLYNATDPNPQDGQFGWDVELVDINLDGRLDLVGAALSETINGVYQGQVQVFSGMTGALLTSLDTPNPQNGGQNGFGIMVDGADVDNNGPREIVVSAYNENAGSYGSAGRVYVFLYDPAQTCPGGDCDGDGSLNGNDNCESSYNPVPQMNTDGAPLNNGTIVPGDDTTILHSDTIGDACDGDADNDGLSTSAELSGPACAIPTSPTDPLEMDSDGDHLTDGWECAMGSDPNDPGSKVLGTPTGDGDGDNIPDLWEMRGYNGNPGGPIADSDGDGCWDMVEIASVDGNMAAADADRIIVARRVFLIPPYVPEPNQDYVLDINKNGAVDDADRIFVARAALLPAPWTPKVC